MHGNAQSPVYVRRCDFREYLRVQCGHENSCSLVCTHMLDKRAHYLARQINDLTQSKEQLYDTYSSYSK